MLKSLANAWVPETVRRLTRRCLKAEAVPLVTLAQAFPRAEKLEHFPSEVVPTPEAVGMPFKDVVAELNRPTYEPGPVWSAVVDGALYCPRNRVLMTPQRQVIAESLSPPITGAPPHRVYEPFDRSALNVVHVEKLSGWSTSVFGHRKNYFHTLLDNLPRLHLLHHTRYQQLERIQLLVTHQLSEQEEFFLKKMCPPNVESVIVEEGRLYETEKFIFPSFLVQESAAYLPRAYFEWFRNLVLPDRPSRQDRRIFINRERAGKRRILNKDEVHALLDRFGYELYVLEELSLEEQIELFYDAAAVVGPHGAGWTNLVFAPEYTPAVELFASQHVVPNYYYLSKVLSSPYIYMTHNRSGIHDDFEVDMKELERHLAHVEHEIRNNARST